MVRALGTVMTSLPRRYGGYIAHLGIIIMAVGITASSMLQVSHEATLRPGESMTIGDFNVRYQGMWAEDEASRLPVGATLEIERKGRSLGIMEPRLNYYPTQADPVPTPAVRSRMTDLYLILLAFQSDGSSATISAIVEPLVIWIWIGGGIVGFGALFGLGLGMRVRGSSRDEIRSLTSDRVVRGEVLAGVGGES
jgi:cytochrome c-type biogenesis protein CcmF